MTEFVAQGYGRQSFWPRGTEDRVLGPGLLMTDLTWSRGTDDRVLGPGVLIREFKTQGY